MSMYLELAIGALSVPIKITPEHGQRKKTLMEKKSEKLSEKDAGQKSGNFWQIFGMATALKVILIPAYYSTDFEVHRNWLAITHTLPLHRWYVEATSEWTLDYPPFFAYFEWMLSQVGRFVDTRMLDVQNLNYASEKTVYFQRGSVICMDLVYAFGAHSCLRALGIGKQTYQLYFAASLLLLLNVGLIFVDHIHFQYNGFLFGILFLSISALLHQRFLWSAFAFSVLLNFKHIFLYMAPAFGVFYLKFYCLGQAKSGTDFFKAMLKLLAVGLTPFVFSFGPFWQQIPQLLQRLFPFKRGLTHAYWAPNLWALYNTADRVAASVLQRTVPMKASTTSGLVQEVEHVVLPKIKPVVTFALTLIFMVPILVKLFQSTSKKQSQLLFLRAVVLCACSSFMFGWHVHEKAILMCLIPLCLLALLHRTDAKYALFLSIVGYFSLFPLLFEVDLLLVRYSLYLAYISMAYAQFWRIYKSRPDFNVFEGIYFLGFIAIPLYEHFISVLLGLHTRLPFLPLLLTSGYSALGVTYFFIRYYIYALDLSWSSFQRSSHTTGRKTSSTRRKYKTK